MNFEKLNTWLTFVANVGVIIGLIFLVVELRQSNNQAAAATEQDRANNVDLQFQDFASSDYLPEIYVKIVESGVESLSSVEFSRAQAWENARLTRMIGQARQYHQGYLGEDIYQTVLAVAARSLPLWKALGLTDLSRIGPAAVDFIEFVESTIQESE